MLAWVGSSVCNRSPRSRSIKYCGRSSTLIVITVLYAVATLAMVAKLFRAHPEEHGAFSGFQIRKNDVARLPSAQLRPSRAKITQKPLRSASEPEVWARGPAGPSTAVALRDALETHVTEQLRSLCGRCLYRTLTSYVRVQDHGQFTVVLTGISPQCGSGTAPCRWLHTSRG